MHNFRVMRIAAAVFVVALDTCANAQPRPDSCQALIPRSLARPLTAAFPGYRTPLETDNAPDDIEYSKAHGGTGCLGVATADFTGEGKTDYVIGLTALKGSSGLAIIALPKKGGWSFQRIRSWTEDARYLQYVDVAQPGRYERTQTNSAPLGPGEKRSLECPHWGARVGTVEATGIVYCYESGQWFHVWVSPLPPLNGRP
jgi:hypothetical protein